MTYNFTLENFLSKPTSDDFSLMIFDKNNIFIDIITPNVSHYFVSNNCLVIKITNKNDLILSFESKEIAQQALIKLDNFRYQILNNYPTVTSGSSGISGTSGVSGSSGLSGESGTSGVSGSSGVSGDSGTSGISGSSGSSGLTGISGSSGSSGYSSHPVQLSDVILDVANWYFNSGTSVYEYTYSNVIITENSIVDIVPNISSSSIVELAEIYSMTNSINGSVIIYAKNSPTGDITVYMNIFY